MSNLAEGMLVGRVDFGESSQARSASYSAEDAMAVTIVRLYHEGDELRATVAMLQEQARILAGERDEARRDLEEEMRFHHRTHGECVIAQCELMDVKKERDEARLAGGITFLMAEKRALENELEVMTCKAAGWQNQAELNANLLVDCREKAERYRLEANAMMAKLHELQGLEAAK